MDGYQKDSEETITRVEMQRISNAIRRFKADTGYWPKTETENGSEFGANNDIIDYAGTDSANFNFLFNKPDEDISNWNPEYAIGWHGPYINLDAIKTIIIDPTNTPKAGCSGLANNVVTAVTQRLYGLVDRFQQLRERNTGERYCMLTRDDKNPTEFTVTKYSGSPYLYETTFTDPDSALCDSVSCIALRSFGSDGVDNNGADTSDDIVFVLQVN
jgi:hypothetical protein